MFNFFVRKRAKKKVLLCGNCVTACIPQFFSLNDEFNKRYELIESKPIFMIQPQDVEIVKKQTKECDVFITQPIVGGKYADLGIDTASIKKILKPTAQLIVMPVPYFSGYFPEQFYLHDKSGALIGEFSEITKSPAPYHNKIVFKGFINGLSEDNVLDSLYQDNCFPPDFLKKNLKDTLDELRVREQSTDFGISDFIEENYKDHRLFYTLNHPTNYLLNYLCERLLSLLDIAKNSYKGHLLPPLDHEPLDFIVTPILPSVVKSLELSGEVLLNNEKYHIEYIKQCFDFYRKNPELVTLNKNDVDYI